MKPKDRTYRRGIALLCLLTLINGHSAQAQQTQNVIVVSSDEYWVVRPATCPTYLHGGLVGWLLGYPNGGFTWTSDWTRYRVPNLADYSHAEYHPSSYDGYAQGKGDYILSGDGILSGGDGEARWYEPELFVECTATDKYYMGHIVSVTERYRVLENRGDIVVCRGRTGLLDEPTGDYPGGASGGGPNATYSPYSQFGDGDGCEDQSSSGGGGGNTTTCHDEYVYVEISYDDGATWVVIWEGYAQVCQ